MKKIFLLILLVILFTPINKVLADEVEYNLEYRNKKLYETITYKIYDYKKIQNGGSIGDIVIDGNKNPFYNNNDIVYNKTISQNGNDYIVVLKYSYEGTEILNSRVVKNCFQNREIYSTDEYYEFKSLGRFNCLDTDKIVVNITSNMTMEGNGNKADNTYTWEINPTDIDNPNIRIKIYKKNVIKETEKNEENKEETEVQLSQPITTTEKIKENIVYIIGAIALILVGIIAYVITSKKQNKY